MNSKVNVKCIICKRRFPEPLFNVHICARSYDCNICEKTFAERKGLAYHKRTHTGEKPYECEICKKAFNSSSDLIKHSRVHTGEKPYSCDVCQKSYTTSSALSRHNKTAAHIEKMKCENTNIPLTQASFVDCGEAIKEEDIKEEIKDDGSVDDPLSIQGETTKGGSENIIIEVKEEGIDLDPFCVQEIHYSGDEENSKVVDDIEIDIVEHKIETDI